jgi:hypothetical protein
MMIGVLQGAAATHGNKPRVPVFGQDHETENECIVYTIATAPECRFIHPNSLKISTSGSP